MSKVYTIFQD